MAIDIARLRNKLKEMKDPKSAGSKKPLWKPSKEEEKVIRLLDYPHAEDPFIELWFHYGVGKERTSDSNFLCPRRTYGKECPVCEAASALYNGPSSTQEDKDVAKTLFAKQRFYAVVVDRGDSTNTPKFWGFGKTVYKTLLEEFCDPDVGDYTALESGLDCRVIYEQPAGQTYPSTTLRFARKPTPFLSDPGEVQKVVDCIPKIEDVYVPVTKAQIENQLNIWLEISESNAEEMSTETVKGSAARESTSTAATALQTSVVESPTEIDAAFEEALGDL